MKLAVVDDKESVRRAIARLLRVLGHDVSSFPSAEEFEDSGVHVDCAVVDVWMPGMGGIELCKRLLSCADRISVVLISGACGTGEREYQGPIPQGAASLAKPLDGEELMEAIREAIGKAHG